MSEQQPQSVDPGGSAGTEGLVGLLGWALSLKRVPRQGWLVRGVPQVESVADHGYGVAFTVLALAEALDAEGCAAGLDLERALTIALLHDLPEAWLTDLPATAVRLLPAGVKRRAEMSALQTLLSPLPRAPRLAALWQEFESGSSPEGRLVRDADKLEMMLQCRRYEQSGSRGLDEFWQVMDRHEWFFPLSGRIYAVLRASRPAERGAGS